MKSNNGNKLYTRIKPWLDRIAAAIILLLLSPAFLIIALIIKINDQGPVFFSHERVGKGGKLFGLLKFRSMVPNADKIGPYFTCATDPRVTRLGRILRKTSLDELPQFINVLKGEMSLIGPRPDVPAQRGNYTEQQWQLRHSIKPGISGLAQAKKRSQATPSQRLHYDMFYARHYSLSLDILIFFATIKQVVLKGGK